MPPRYNRDVEKVLQNKFEFQPVQRGKADDHRWYELQIPGVPKIMTHFSHAREDIRPTLWRKIADELKVRGNYLDGMIDCTNSKDAYYEQVRTDPYPPWPDYLLRASSKAKP
jgi:hypothetical protein